MTADGDTSIGVYITVGVRIVVKVFGVICSTNLLDLPEDTYTFNSYENYLEFFTNKYKEQISSEDGNCDVKTNVKCVGWPLAVIAANIVNREKLTEKTITNHDLTMIDKCRELPESVRKVVGHLVCPLVVLADDVKTNPLWKSVHININGKELMEHIRCTGKYKEELSILTKDIVS